ncbi:cyclin-like protein [Meira miltonrushii]|uniref:Cyclin-like protein n=1 Tax=Meira miltonrushii TaxID=1280837 RepID=A0A316VAM9_9BASI|nr:cyclin-like protein [Meira miltonrushii]PWN34657.1 cyclin-like protein [Meira miltonrushii]
MPQLLNTLATKEQVTCTPSRQDGIPCDLEDEIRVYGCRLIQEAGMLLGLPQVTMACAQVLFQRFWFVSSLRQFRMLDIAMGCLFLSSKLEETPKRIRDLINVFDYLVKRDQHQAKYRPGPRSHQLGKARRKANTASTSNGTANHHAQIPPFEYKPMTYFANEFYDTKDALVIAEMQILKRLGFQVQVNLPYATMVNYLQLLGLTGSQTQDSPVAHDGQTFAQLAWAILNDSLQTTIYCLFPPHVVAVSAIYLTSTLVKVSPPLPQQPKPWWELFDVSREEVRIVCSHIMRLYNDDPGEQSDSTKPTNDQPYVEASGGMASRVREEWGGLAEFSDRNAIRDWLSYYGSSSTKGKDG